MEKANITGLGSLDWNIIEAGSSNRILSYSYKKKKLKKQMVLHLGLTLDKPERMVYLIREFGKLNQKNEVEINKLFRLSTGQILLKQYGIWIMSKYSSEFFKFLNILKENLGAEAIHYDVHYNTPNYVKIDIILPRRKLTFPSKFIYQLTETINLKIK